jgi:excisionase family DNA binding protein
VTDPQALGAVNARLLSVAEVADLSGLKHQAVRRAIRRGELPAIKLCGRIRIRPTDLDAWHEAGQLRGANSPQPPRTRLEPASTGLRRLLDSPETRA